jgi:hypothetical protein
LLGIILKGHGKLEPQRAGFVMRDKELPPLAVVDQRSHQASVSIILAEGLRTSPLFDQDSLNPSDSDPFTLTQVTSIDLKHPQNTKAARKHIVSNDHTLRLGTMGADITRLKTSACFKILFQASVAKHRYSAS